MLGLDFLRPKEKFLLLEIAPKRTSGLLLAVDRDKNISAEKFWEDFSFEQLRRAPFGALLRRMPFGATLHGDPLKSLRKRQIIVSAHPSFTTTIVTPAFLERDEKNFPEPVTLHELENLFSRAIGKIFNQHRGEAGGRLGVPELDAVLVGARADSFKIDGHLILNPMGFHGKTVEAVLDLTFTTRDIFEDLGEFFKAREGFFFTNLPRAALFALSRLEPPPINLVLVRGGESFYFLLDKAAWGHSIREGKIGWSLERVFEALRGVLGTSPKVTLRTYAKHAGGELSGHFSRSVDKALALEKNSFLAEIKRISPRGAVYIDSPVPLPFNFPLRLGRATLVEAPLDELLKRFGFRLANAAWDLDRSETFSKLAPFFEFYFDKSDSEINRRLRRRLHWLIQ